MNANTLYQNWDGSQSRNHIMFGNIVDYFFKGLAGIRPMEDTPGFKRFLIQPSFENELEWVEAGHESLYGLIRCHWKREKDGLVLELTVPPNTQTKSRLASVNMQ